MSSKVGGKAKKSAARKPAAKKPAAKKRKANPALLKKFKPDAKLAALVGSKARPRSQFLKDLWVYFKKKGLQDPKNGQNLLVKKDKVARDWAGKDMITMFEVMSILNKHISE